MSKRPVQVRSQRRVELILEAAADEIVRSGAGGFSMNAVAKRTKISPGSLYQFFPSREDLIASLYERYIEGLQSLASKAASCIANQDSLTASQVVGAFLRPCLIFYQSNPAYVELHHAVNRPYAPNLREAKLDSEILAVLSDAFRRLAPNPDAPLHLLATLTLETAHAILSLCALKSAKEAKLLCDEAEVMLATYIDARLRVRQ